MGKVKEVVNAIPLVMALIIFAVMGALIVSSILDNSTFTDIPTTGTNTNESLTALNAMVAQSLAILSTQPSASCTMVSLVNATTAEVVPTNNYTVSACTVILIAGSDFIDEDLNATYTYSYASGTSLAGVNATEVAQGYGSFITNLIAFLAVIGTIIGVIWLVLYVKKLFDKKEGLQNITS